jgi:hypothetical protein
VGGLLNVFEGRGLLWICDKNTSVGMVQSILAIFRSLHVVSGTLGLARN